MSHSNLYFAYGSNIDAGQMFSRLGSAEFIAIAVLDNHRLVFNRRGDYRAGGVASIEPKRGDHVYGVVWRIPDDGFSKLDRIEGPNSYDRIPIRVQSLAGDPLDCETYVAYPQGHFAPDNNYLDVIVRAAEAHGFPEEYVAYLESFRSAV